MTPREIKDALYDAARKNNARAALLAAKEFEKQQLWTSSPHWNPEQPDGTEILLMAGKPGTCAICLREFKAGAILRWRSRVDTHERCWRKIYGR